MADNNKDGRPALAFSDASAGCIAAILLFGVQKFPEGSDIKVLCMYMSPVAALLINNTLVISAKYLKFRHRKHALKSHYNELSQQYNEYVTVENPDPEVKNEYNRAMKDTRIAMIHNSVIDVKKQSGDVRAPINSKDSG